jgi:hypothetical protein
MGIFDNVNGMFQKAFNTVKYGVQKYIADPVKSVALGAYGVAKNIVSTVHQDVRDLVGGVGAQITGARNTFAGLGNTLIGKTGDTVSNLGQSLSFPLVVVGGLIAGAFILKK